MSTTVQLPASLQQQITGVGRRARLLRGVRGASLLVLVLAAAAGAAVLADFLLDGALPLAARAAALAAWSVLGATWLLLGVVGPLLRRLDPADLAAAVEEKYPQLGERLTSSVELCQGAGAGNGSPALIDLLVRETEARATPLDFRPAVPERGARYLAAAAAVAALLLLAPAAAYPSQYGVFLGRFLLPWRSPHALPDFTFGVTPGDAVAARGRPLTLAADLTPRHSRIALPAAAVLVLTDALGQETRHEMGRAAGEPARYEFTLRVPADFRYRVEAGNAASAPHTVTAVTPVDLAPDSPAITVTPPEYARSAVEGETLTGLLDVTALRHSQVAFAFRFTRPAVSAVLEWTPQAGEKAAPTTRLPMALSPDRTAATLAVEALTSGSYRVVLEAEHGIRTVRDGAALSVKEDQPPALLRFSGKENARSARPFDRVPMEARLADDVGVAGAEVVYRVNGEKQTHAEPFVLEGGNAREATARHQFLLAGKVKEGDEIAYRIRYRDNLPAKFGGPHVLYHPADRWLKLTILKQSGSIKEQEILAQRDAIGRKLEKIKADIKQETNAAYKVRAESFDQDALSRGQTEQTQDLRRQNQASAKALHDLADEAAETPGLASLAAGARDVAHNEMRQSDAALRDTLDRKATAERREQRFRDADRELGSALRKLDALMQANKKLAQERLDQAKVESLADRQKDLADRAAELAAKHPVLDPTAKKQAEEVKREQAELEQELQQLTQNSEKLQQALEEARAEEARQAGQKARDLAQAQRDLAQASDETERKEAAGRLADLARKQKELAEKADRLAQETAPTAKANRTSPLKPEQATRAVASLEKGEADKALDQQERAARELERAASELERAAHQASDPREAARQLARMEEDLARRTRLEAADRRAARPLPERLKELRKEQEAVLAATEGLSLPPKRQDVHADRQRAQEAVAAASRALDKGHANEAQAKMEQARQALQQLANKLPSLGERRRQAAEKVRQMKRNHDEIARKLQEAERNPREAAGKRAEAARKQADNAEAMAKLDAPNEEPRRDRARGAADQALQDLLDGRKGDQKASQQAARRELDRLEQALAGQKPADEKARELAKRQQALAEKAEKLAGASKAQQDAVRNEQRQVAAEARDLDAKEAPALKRQAARAAEQAARQSPASEEGRNAMREAAKKLDALARAMRGEEGDAEKAKRLAAQQGEAAARPQTAWPPQEQKDIASEAKQVRAGDRAQAEKKKAEEALARAEKAGAADRADAQRAAAEALKDLADKLAGPRPQAGDGPPKKLAQDLAAQQRRLAQETREAQQSAARKPGGADKKALEESMQKLAARQRALNDEASKLPTRGAEKAVQRARSAMNQAEAALGQKDPAQAGQKQQEAAAALERLARALPDRADDPPAKAGTPAGGAKSALASKEQAEAARGLAKEQRALREAVRQANEQAQAGRRADLAQGKENPAGKLAAEQEAIARDAARLAEAVAKEQGARSAPARQAAQSGEAARQAARGLQAGALEKAAGAGKESAGRLEQLAKDLSQTPRGGATPDGADTLQQARQLSKRQAEVNRQLAPLAGSRQAERAQQQARQADLARQAGELMQGLRQLGQTPGKSSAAQNTAREAAGQATQAQNQMQQAARQGRQGQQSAAQQSREQAAGALDRAAQQARQSAEQAQQASGQTPGQPSQAQAGEALGQAKGQMQQARGQMSQGKPSAAQSAMQKAAAALQKAGEQMAKAAQQGQPKGPGNPSGEGVAAGGAVDAQRFAKELGQLGGKKWGELPGQLRTKIVQEMKAKYGEDYARMIKLYFEQIADTRRK
jgi:hypothetical protein